MPKICYVQKKLRTSSLAVIEQANEIIAEFAADGFELTLRQLYYQFVSRDLIENTQKSYKRLGSVINDGRLAGLIDWNAIEDRGRNLLSMPHWANPAGVIESAADGYGIDKWKGQEYRVEVWVEKQALESVIGQAADGWDCPYFSCKGYTSQSEMWRASRRFERYHAGGQHPVIIHLGDHDPSGIDMTRDIDERNNLVFGVDVTIDRIALNMDQIQEYEPPPNPAKVTDSRFREYAANYGEDSWELDALNPSTLKELIEDRIRHYCDVDLYNERVAREDSERALLQEVASRWPEVLDALGEAE